MKTDTELSRSNEARTLRSRLSAVRRKSRLVTVATGAAMPLCALIASFAVEMMLDWLIELPWLARALILLGVAGGVGYLTWRFVVLPVRRWASDDAVALVIERGLPDFRSRFIASVQLARSEDPAISHALVRALLAETAVMAATLDFRKVVKMDELKRSAMATGGALVAAIGLFALGGASSPVLLRRALLSTETVPRKTRIVAVTGDCAVAIGADLKIEASAEGVVPKGGWLAVKTASGRTHKFPLTADEAKRGHFACTVKSVQEAFVYSVRLGDATTREFRVEAFSPPVVTGIEFEQIFPPYTKLAPTPRENGDLRLLAGSELNVKATVSSPVKEGAILPAGATANSAALPMEVNPQDRKKLTGRLPVPAKDLTGFAIQFVDEHGMKSPPGAVYRIETVPDRPPAVRLTYPEHKEELVTPQGTMVVAFEANDDFGVGRIVLHYALDPASERTVELDPGVAGTKNVRRRFDWKLASLPQRLAVGNTMDYWIEVFDNNDVTGPSNSVTEHFQVKIVSPEAKRAELVSRFMSSLGGLNSLSTDQDQLNKKLGTVIGEKSKQP